MARFSLLVVGVILLCNPSCLITSTAEFQEPVTSPPFVDANTAFATPLGKASVPITRMIQVDEQTSEVTLSVRVRSDDAGRQLNARTFVNYKNNSGDRHYDAAFVGDTLPPGTFDEIRTITSSLNLSSLEAPGCYQVSFVITHEFDQSRIPLNQDDTAILVWWMVIGDPSKLSLDKCPGLISPSTSDANLDGGE